MARTIWSLDEELAQILVAMRQSVMGRPQPYYHQAITQPMRQVLRKILQCPYQGLMKRMYLESKAVKLITLHLQQCQEQSIEPLSNLSDSERIYQTKDILLSNLESPPSLIKLARRVGINDFKLKRGFRQIFGTSAFQYLHDYRLEKAQQLLATGKRK